MRSASSWAFETAHRPIERELTPEEKERFFTRGKIERVLGWEKMKEIANPVIFGRLTVPVLSVT
jgi:hypothetical protein